MTPRRGRSGCLSVPDFGQSEVAAVLEQLGYFEDGESITPAELREFLVVQCDLDGDVVRDAIAHVLRSSG